MKALATEMSANLFLFHGRDLQRKAATAAITTTILIITTLTVSVTDLLHPGRVLGFLGDLSQDDGHGLVLEELLRDQLQHNRLARVHVHLQATN